MDDSAAIRTHKKDSMTKKVFLLQYDLQKNNCLHFHCFCKTMYLDSDLV